MPTSKEEEDIFTRTPAFHTTDAAYILPNDKAEQSRLLDQHKGLVALVKNRIIHAPVNCLSTVIDIGCGPLGILTREFSTLFPMAAHVYGIDLSPVQPHPDDESHPNLTFIQGNFRELTHTDPRFHPRSADFVFSRLLICGMTDWPGYVRETYDILKPGAWCEMGDYVEDTFYTDPAKMYPPPHERWEWLRAIRRGGSSLGLDMDAGVNIQQYMTDAGFVDVRRWEYHVPYWRGAWEEQPEARKFTEHLMGDRWGLYWHFLPTLLKREGYDRNGVERLRGEMRRDLGEEEGKYQLFCVTIGRKPEAWI